ncbi:MAG: AAA family ATPase [Epsilonproteobacteria bacterium]|nr:AAA family ATPase [Campylobacterota bacterium]
MITRFFARSLVGFEKVEVTFGPGLTVITGPSGAGKSVFMGALLALTGRRDVQAPVSEMCLKGRALKLPEGYENGEDEAVVRAVKKEKTRYFLNDLTLSKKRLADLLAPYVRHVGQGESRALSDTALLALIDDVAGAENPAFQALKAEHGRLFEAHKKVSAELERIRQAEREARERREFAVFEIERIEAVAPKPGEDEELMAVKRRLSRREKIGEAVARASAVFELEGAVEEALALMEEEAPLFSEAMNDLRLRFDRAVEALEELEELDVEAVLDRIEALADLKRRYGSIEEALAYCARKKEELAAIERMDETKEALEKEEATLRKALTQKARALRLGRQEALKRAEEMVNGYLSPLRLPPLRFGLESKPHDATGTERVRLVLEGSSLETLSGGELSRVNLALLACQGELAGGGGVLLVDEIDANVSGDESIAIARLLKRLARNYQVIAVSHQPHLSAAAEGHLLVVKEKGVSRIRALARSERKEEIARMLAGRQGLEEAEALAENLLEEFAR